MTSPIRLVSVFLRVMVPIAVLALTACSENRPPAYLGYIEGEFVYLAAPQAGYLKTLDAPRGTRVKAGAVVFELNPDADADALAEAQAKAQAAREKVENLKEPRRQPEIAALEAVVRSAQAELQLADLRLTRQQSLASQKFVSQANVDEARSARDQAAAQLETARQQLANFRSTFGRQPEVRGAQADEMAAQAQTAQKRWIVERKTVTAPSIGEIADTYFRPGEWVPAGATVASLLPDARRRLRFYVPETALATLRPGQMVEAGCDSCAAPIRARIDFIASQAEYTPPVIYSRGSREKLVFRVEASPVPEQAATLRPGLPIDVRLTGG